MKYSKYVLLLSTIQSAMPACGLPDPADGIGRANFDAPTPRASSCGLQINEVQAMESHFVEIAAGAHYENIESQSWALCHERLCIDFQPPPNITNPYVETGADGLSLGAQGELALYADSGHIGDPLTICDYIAWGVAPQDNPHSNAGAAVAAGLWNADDYLSYDGSSTFSFARTTGPGSAMSHWGCDVTPSPGLVNGTVPSCTH